MNTYQLRLYNGTGNPRRVAAGKVREGDFLLGLDNGYVYEEPTGENYWSERHDRVRISFHDFEGNENEAILQPNVPVLVGRHDDEGDDLEWDDEGPVCEVCGEETEEKDSHGTLMCEDCQDEDEDDEDSDPGLLNNGVRS